MIERLTGWQAGLLEVVLAVTGGFLVGMVA
jgi:hypothetical protein